MISSTLGALLGGTTVAGQYGVESLAPRPILPPNGGGGDGRYSPSMVVVALGDPGAPLICCDIAEEPAKVIRLKIESAQFLIFIRSSPVTGHGPSLMRAMSRR